MDCAGKYALPIGMGANHGRSLLGAASYLGFTRARCPTFCAPMGGSAIQHHAALTVIRPAFLVRRTIQCASPRQPAQRAKESSPGREPGVRPAKNHFRSAEGMRAAACGGAQLRKSLLRIAACSTLCVLDSVAR